MSNLGSIGADKDVADCKLISPTPAATITIVVTAVVQHIVADWTAAENETVEISGPQAKGSRLMLIITNSGSPRTITFGTGLLADGNLQGSGSKVSTIEFISNATVYLEISRTVAM